MGYGSIGIGDQFGALLVSLMALRLLLVDPNPFSLVVCMSRIQTPSEIAKTGQVPFTHNTMGITNVVNLRLKFKCKSDLQLMF